MRIIAGRFKGRKLSRPSANSTRPTTDSTRESIFNILSSILARLELSFEHMHVLDVFAGSGALGFEALSRGAVSATFIEKDLLACKVIDHNCKTLKIEDKTTVIQGNALNPVAAKVSYNLIFLDPPYERGMIRTAFQALLNKGWIAPNALIVMELSTQEDSPLIEGIEMIAERIYGSTKILIVRLSQNDSHI